ncbi:unnamed protein product (macronuclear) [Paramecium tetraurelia]|uniref:4a-hydroxytetrahydrobiopterin dehydratase n=1 Tax=Paramecium tetraurelia TaxID=5888 RepID=A0BZF4_PARTE|nr:uncharacterized protein GSPATT00033774001 [Paramecium tetraurelia]CAK63921.1 unnamed protein product [Paramecium tetraurelia]|eukprot:XP_001431319.1 hypothetical protein (macronuclear) [Paramecium tetraurelia strain d4-2]
MSIQNGNQLQYVSQLVQMSLNCLQILLFKLTFSMLHHFSKYRFTLNKVANLDSIKVFIKDLKDVASIVPSKLDETEVQLSLQIHALEKNWKINSKSLAKEYKFETFKQAFVFMNTVSHLADQMSHYPKWINVYNKLSVEITTQDVSGISVKDVLLAYLMESTYKDVKELNPEHVGEISKVSAPQLLQNWNANFTQYQEILKKNVHKL